MKNNILTLFISAVALLFLSACGSTKTVPDKTIQWVIDDYLKTNEYYGGVYTDYQTEITHDPDSETKTDTVKIKLSITYPHLTASTKYEATYQYDKSSDLWNLIRGGDWESLYVEKYDMTSSFKLWSEAIQSAGFEVEDKAEGREIVSNLVEDSFSEELSTSVKDGWYIEAWSNSAWSSVEILCITMNGKSEADSIYEVIRGQFKNELELLEYDGISGGNYTYSRYTDYDRAAYSVLIRIDSTVYAVFAEDTDIYMEYDINLFLQQVGFVPMKKQ